LGITDVLSYFLLEESMGGWVVKKPRGAQKEFLAVQEGCGKRQLKAWDS
jgi:hypothetical protein